MHSRGLNAFFPARHGHRGSCVIIPPNPPSFDNLPPFPLPPIFAYHNQVSISLWRSAGVALFPRSPFGFGGWELRSENTTSHRATSHHIAGCISSSSFFCIWRCGKYVAHLTSFLRTFGPNMASKQPRRSDLTTELEYMTRTSHTTMFFVASRQLIFTQKSWNAAFYKPLTLIRATNSKEIFNNLPKWFIFNIGHFKDGKNCNLTLVCVHSLCNLAMGVVTMRQWADIKNLLSED